VNYPIRFKRKIEIIMKQNRSDFYTSVWQIVEQIPIGRVTSYVAIARTLGAGKSARMVGYAMNACHLTNLNVPAHRVVNNKGLLTGKHHFGAPEKMQELLESEGLKIENDTVKNFTIVFWDPAKELNL